MHWREALPSVMDSQFESMVALRRHLHMNPEASGLEFDTSQLLYGRFLDAGFQVRQGPNGCGVLVDFVCGQPNSSEEMFAIRADIDALRIHDEKDGLLSQHASRVDACLWSRRAYGHGVWIPDGHSDVVAPATAGFPAPRTWRFSAGGGNRPGRDPA